MILLSATSCTGDNPAANDPSKVRAVSISRTSITLSEIGESFTLTASVIPSTAADSTITWSTTDDSVATCDDGVVTAVGYGVAVIRATAVGGASATCTVSVPNPTPNLSISSKEVLISSLTETPRLRAYDINGEDVTEQVVWTTTNHAIASCEAGVVTPISYGYCTVRASLKSGHYAECFIKIEDPTKTSPTLSKNEIEFSAAGESDTLRIEGVSGQVSWISSNEEVVTVEGGVVTAVSEGVAVVIAVDGNSNTAACIVYVGEHETPKIPEDVVRFEVKDVPRVVHYVNQLSGQIEASVMIISYTVEWEVEDEENLRVDTLFNMVKIYDAHGLNSGDTFFITGGFYTENDYLVSDLPYEFSSIPLGEEFQIGQRVRFITQEGVIREGYIAFYEYVER